MVDPLGFPTLAGAALTQAFGFLYGRMAALLDRRTAVKQAQALAGDPSTVLRGELSAMVPDQAALDERREQLETLADSLEIYLNQPELLDASGGVHRNLGRLRSLLEEIYEQQITFAGEDRPASGIKVRQNLGNLEGMALGLDVDHYSTEAAGEVIQDVEEVRPGGTIIGAKIRRLE